MKALILVDIQNDFCQGGALEVPNANEIIPIANALMPTFDLVVATQDWHPANHKSFAAMHPWRKPGNVIDLNGVEQVLWPMHCVQNSFGAEFHPELNHEMIHKVFQKGTNTEVDSYSGFFDVNKKGSTGMAEFLEAQKVSEVFVLGLATDYCVKYTALDAIELGLKTNLILEACRGINATGVEIESALTELENAKVSIIRDVGLRSKSERL